jgi:hypothetical protein
MEADERAKKLADGFHLDRCVSCGTAGVKELQRVEFLWRKQEGSHETGGVRAEHVSVHALCAPCLAAVRTKRRWFWPIRYAGGVVLAISICGIVTCPTLIWLMRLNPSELRSVRSIGILAVAMLPVAVFALWLARGFSVPSTLFEFTRGSWECIRIRPLPIEPVMTDAEQAS